MNLVRKLKDDYDAVLRDVDVLVMPTVPVTARRHAPPGAGPLVCAKTTGLFPQLYLISSDFLLPSRI